MLIILMVSQVNCGGDNLPYALYIYIANAIYAYSTIRNYRN